VRPRVLARASKPGLHDALTKNVAIQILRAEMDGHIASLNTEGALARQLKVSRTATREAIKVLAAKGLVEVRRKVGIRVKPRSEWHLLDPDLLLWHCEAGLTDLFVRNVHELRLCIEPMAARRAAERGGERDVALIVHCYRKMELSAKKPDAFVRADVEFHGAIFRACHNDLLEQLNRTVRGALQALHDLVKVSGGGPKVALPLHKAVLDSIADRNGEKAQAAMERLVNLAARDLYALLHQEIEPRAFVSAGKN
jgi:GntR family transcriptional regulator, galactonate operon transcriptional repressor